MNRFSTDWTIPDNQANPIIDNRIVSDCTFALRLKSFIEQVEVCDLPGEEEKEYILHVANRLLGWQKLTVMTEEESNYLKMNNLI